VPEERAQGPAIRAIRRPRAHGGRGAPESGGDPGERVDPLGGVRSAGLFSGVESKVRFQEDEAGRGGADVTERAHGGQGRCAQSADEDPRDPELELDALDQRHRRLVVAVRSRPVPIRFDILGTEPEEFRSRPGRI
jgi:hypothetical protein